MLTQADYERLDGPPVEDHIIQLHGISWEDYERLLEMRGDHSAPRICYLEGTVEILKGARSDSADEVAQGVVVDADFAGHLPPKALT